MEAVVIKEILLSTKKQLDAYMNPMRQRILREMRLSGDPHTPKELSDRLGISASSVQHHMARLLELGVVELHHTRQIKGITARYYLPAQCTVRLGLEQEAGASVDEKLLVAQNLVANVQQGFLEAAREKRRRNADREQLENVGDILTGVAFLEPGEGRELVRMIQEFLRAREVKKPGQEAWEYALVTYNADWDDTKRVSKP